MREGEVPRLDPDAPEPREAHAQPASAWRTAIHVVAVTHLAFVALAWAGAYFFGATDGAPGEGVLDMWRRWDTEHYVDIAEHGYDSPETTRYAEAFFPLYPLGIRAFIAIGFNPVFAGMLISTAASVVALAYLYRLADEELGPDVARRAVLLLALFPTAVFLTAAYSEALFLAGAIPAFYYARRGRWILVGLPAAVAMGTRVAGAFVLVGLAVEFLRQRGFDRKRVLDAGVAASIALLPLIGYMAYLWAATGDPLYFFDAQRLGWDRSLTDPRDAFGATWRTFYGDYPPNWLIAWRVEIAAAVGGLFFTGWALKRREYGYGAYMGTLMIPLLVSSWYLSIPRMLLSMFPIPLLLASVTRDGRRFDLLLAAFAVLAALGVVVFTRGRWFF